ncbi:MULTISPECIES: MliC family protein [unclassified Pseudomonas]|uniref:MliC family protein n=1 Tax=unclassified Pseudomonas TaxID=196821 RepID=UPI002AC8B4EE|nr:MULTISPECIES: MliC family protein [unclassified Pseudomonas]MEB0040342.1 MliC family protein [Pseudomonas sp. MH10]MEB0077371.1 MliC family protein [Pseudomonas sp. MH10out]MEB0092847.1 MliC family protein [Pseudomonas sp. CCI4.2]MEB0101174.1 MliC family protein [Pseudomonas sp. CCI3.2]MEB0120549.1 MliC family protein [Pseudomonas sp. CCI1.2]
MKGLIALATLAALGGCASMNPKAPESDTWTNWVCDSKAALLWHYADSAKSEIDLRLLGSDKVYRLKPEPGSSGELYSDGVLAFHIKGDEGLVYWVATNDLIGRGCKAL